MYSIQQIEDREYEEGCGTELENAFAISRMEREPDDSDLISTLVGRGFYVLVHVQAQYCPRTDASMGESQRLVCASRSEGIINRRINLSFGDDYGCDMTYLRVAKPRG